MTPPNVRLAPMARQPSPRARDQRGSMSVEVVILTPVLLAFVLLVVAGGRYVGVKGDVEAAARDAARAASLERSWGAAQAAAAQVTRQSLNPDTTCGAPRVSPNFAPGEVIEVHLSCNVSLDGLGLVGLSGSVPVEAVSKSPLDTYRRAE